MMNKEKRLLIIGAGGLGREIYGTARGICQGKRECGWEIAGFLDDRDGILEGTTCPASIVGSPGNYEPRPDDLFVCAIGAPGDKRKYAKLMRDRGGEFAKLISPAAIVTPGNTLGTGIVLGPGCLLSCDIRIGDDTCLNAYVTVGHDVRIGKACHVSAYTFLGGGARVGNEVAIHPHATVLPGVEIGDGATVGAGTVVTRDVPPGETVFGVPAMIVKS